MHIADDNNKEFETNEGLENEENVQIEDSEIEETIDEIESEEELAQKEREKDSKWYVVHTYSGHENKVKISIEKMVENRGYIDDIFEVVVPIEEYVSTTGGTEKVKERKLFPGYVFIRMNVNDVTWYLVRNTRGVTGFVGPGSKPVPLRDDEMKAFGVGKVAMPDISIGDKVRVVTGAFEDSVGEIEEIQYDKRKLKTFISIFGRDTSVELDFDDVEKL